MGHSHRVRRFNSLQLVLVIGGLVPTLAAKGQQADPASKVDPPGQTRALLIGCTDYVNEQIPDLLGPANDVKLFRDVLINKFQFPADGSTITTLTGSQATNARISAAFENLARTATPNSQVVILLSGHGAQQPDDGHDEVDGFDEVFCPVDIEYLDHSGTIASGGITDDQIGGWLKRMSDRGANVWLIADSCHNGTLTRGVDPATTGDVARSIGTPNLSRGGQAVGETHETPGGRVVAFYAAPPTHKTYEATFENERHGIFSYALCKVLKTSTERLTYRRLIQRVHAEYERMRRNSPIPQIEAEFKDTVVLGDVQLRGSDIRLSRSTVGYGVNAGRLHGVTEGAILGVFATADDDEPQGYVRITSAESLRAVARPCVHNGKAWADSLNIPLGGFCEIAQSSLDDLRRLKVAVDLYSQASVDRIDRAPLPAVERRYWQAELVKMLTKRDDIVALVELVESPAEADWVVRPATAGNRTTVYVAPTERFEQNLDDEALVMSPFGSDPIIWMSTKLPDIARSCNLIEIAQSESTGDGRRVKIDVAFRALKNADDWTGIPFALDKDPAQEPGRSLHPGDLVGVKLTNPNPFPVYVSVLFVNGRLHTEAWFPNAPGEEGHLLNTAGQHGDSFMPVRFAVDDSTSGLERIVTIAVKAEQGQAPDFAFLASTTRSKAARGETSPLKQLLATAVHAPETARTSRLPGNRNDHLEPHTMQVVSWVTTPTNDAEMGLFSTTGPAEDLKAKIVVEQSTRYHTADRTRAVLGTFGRLVQGNKFLRRPDRFDPYGTVLENGPIRRWQTPLSKSGKTTLSGLLSFTAKSEQWRLSGSATAGASSVVTYAMAGESLRKDDVIASLNRNAQALRYFQYLRSEEATPVVVLQNIVMSTCSVDGSALWGTNGTIQLTGASEPPAFNATFGHSVNETHDEPIIRGYLMHEVILRDGRVVELTDSATAP